jgi:glycosyltransferase involved in cell wall biosynthesis
MTNSVAVCSIFRDEEEFLPEFIACLKPHVDEMVLVDTGSTDKSVEIVRQAGLEPGYFQWCDDFSAAKNYAISQCKSKWILLFDIDERMKEEDLKALVEFLRGDSANDALYLPRVNLLERDWKSEECPVLNVQYILRALRVRPGFEYRNRVHEELEASIKEYSPVGGKFAKADFPLYHLGFAEELNAKKVERNVKIIHMAVEENPEDPHALYYYADAVWSEDSEVYETLKAAWKYSSDDLRYQVGVRILEWVDDFPDTEEAKQCDGGFHWETQLLKIAPESAFVNLRRARRYFASRRLKEAREAYEKAKKGVFSEFVLASQQKEVLDRLGVLYAIEGRMNEASACFILYRKLFGNEPGVYHQILKLLYVRGDYPQFLKELSHYPSRLEELDQKKKEEIVRMLKALDFRNRDLLLQEFITRARLQKELL